MPEQDGYEALLMQSRQTLVAGDFARAFELAVRDGQRLVVGLVDLGHFKCITNKQGHSVRDEVLLGLARLRGGTLRHADRMGRHGSKEFAPFLGDDDSGVEACALRLGWTPGRGRRGAGFLPRRRMATSP